MSLPDELRITRTITEPAPLSEYRQRGSKLDDRADEIRKTLAAPGHPSIRTLAQSLGVAHGTLCTYVHVNAIFVHPETAVAPHNTWTPVSDGSAFQRPYRSPKARKPKPSQKMHMPLTKLKTAKPADRAEMDCLIAEAVAAGKVTKCQPAVARGSRVDAWFERIAS